MMEKWCLVLNRSGGCCFLYFRGEGWDFVENEASFDFCSCLWTYLTECTERFKEDSFFFFFFPFEAILGGPFFVGWINVLRGLIYVDVSLHSNKKNWKTRKVPALVCLLNVPQGRCHAAASRRPAWEAFLPGSRRWVALKHLMCGPTCSLATEPSPRYYLQIVKLHKFEQAGKGWLLLRRGGWGI